ncbi:MAG TPA: hypothetical protein VH596_05895 [Terriglobales bacterium]|jgi:hypothetical protein
MIRLGILFLMMLAWASLWCQDETSTPDTPATSDNSQMSVPPPVSIQSYPTVTGSEERSNYLRAGMTVSTTYSDNVLGGITPNPVSDESYSVWPYIALDETSTRLHTTLSFAPGFTFYQRTTERNEADENLGLNLSYRLSPHTTISFVDSFHKSSTFLNQANLPGESGIAAAPVSPVTIYAPVADQLSNLAMTQFTYQFAPNGMFGVSGTFTNLHYSDPTQVSGLYDSSSKGGSAFYNRRLSGRNYIGVSYQYQRMYAYPTGFTAETQTNTAMFYYTIYLKPTFSFSMFGGPQYSYTEEPGLAPFRAWSPAAGASLSWQGRQTNISLNYSRMIAPGGGLIGAVNQDAAGVSLRRQLTRNLTAGVNASFANNKLLNDNAVAQSGGFSTNGHSFGGGASLEQKLGQHFALGLSYSRIHQSYSNIAAISSAPNTNQGSVSISYQFARPLGR